MTNRHILRLLFNFSSSRVSILSCRFTSLRSTLDNLPFKKSQTLTKPSPSKPSLAS